MKEFFFSDIIVVLLFIEPDHLSWYFIIQQICAAINIVIITLIALHRSIQYESVYVGVAGPSCRAV